MEKESTKRKRMGTGGETEHDDDDDAPTIVEEHAAPKFVDSSERFSSQRKETPVVGDSSLVDEIKQNTAAEATAVGPVFRPKKSKAGASTDETAMTNKKAAKKKKLLSFNAEDDS